MSNIKDLVKRLRYMSWPNCDTAADAIETLDGDVGALKHDMARLMEIANAAEARAEVLRDALLEARSMISICQWDDVEPDADYEAAWNRGLAKINDALGDK